MSPTAAALLLRRDEDYRRALGIAPDERLPHDLGNVTGHASTATRMTADGRLVTRGGAPA